jgi:hypothetical protein
MVPTPSGIPAPEVATGEFKLLHAMKEAAD